MPVSSRQVCLEKPWASIRLLLFGPVSEGQRRFGGAGQGADLHRVAKSREAVPPPPPRPARSLVTRIPSTPITRVSEPPLGEIGAGTCGGANRSILQHRNPN